MEMKTIKSILMFAAVAALALAPAARADLVDAWWKNTDGSMLAATMWQNGEVPNATNHVYMNNGTATLASGELTVGTFTVGTGNGTPNTVAVSGGTVTVTNQTVVGFYDTGIGIVNLSGGIWNAGLGETDIGYASGNGVFNVLGGTLNLQADTYVGNGASTNAVLTLAGGTINLASGKRLIVATDNNTTGVFRASSGTFDATATGASIGIGVNNASIGRMEVSGDAVIKTTGLMVGGFWWWMTGGTGIVTQTGGQVILSGDGDFALANRNGTRGTYTISGGELIASNKTFFVGGQLGSSKDILSEGFLNVSGAGSVTVNELIAGNVSNANGTVTQDGGTVTVLSGTTLGNEGNTTGSYVLNGGTLVANAISGGAGTSSFLFNGGTLKLASAQSALLQSVATVAVGAGGLVVDTDGNAVTIPANLDFGANGGGVTKLGAGTLTLSGSGTWTGATVVKAGTLDAGGRTLTGAIDVASGAKIINAVIKTDNITLYDDSTLSLETYGASYTNYFFGTVTADGGTLKIYNNLDGLLASAAAWYDPSDASSLTLSGTTVTAIANKGASGASLALARRESTDTPTVEAVAALNGKNAIALDYCAGFNSTAAGSIVFTNNQERTLFAVSRRAIKDGEMHALSLSSDYWSYKGYFGFGSFGGWFNYSTNNSTEAMGLNLPAMETMSNSLVSCEMLVGGVVSGTVFDSASASLQSAASTFTMPAAGTGASTDYVSYGGRLTYGGRSSGYVGEALLFACALTPAETADVRSYLVNKWLGAGSAPALGTTVLDTLALTNNAVVDLDGAAARIGTITGAGTISNGTLTVTNTIVPIGTLALASGVTVSGGTLVITMNADGATVSGKFAFAGALDLSTLTLKVVNGSNYDKATEITILTAAGGLTGNFKSTNRADDDRWSVRVNRAAGTVTLAPRTGFVIRICDADLEVPSAWITTNLGLDSTVAANAVAISNALVSAGANGLVRWESYALGLDPNSASSVVLCAAKQDASAVDVTFFAPNVSPASNTAFSIAYALEGSNDRAASTWPVLATSTTNAIPVSLSSASAYSYFRLCADIIVE